MSEANDPNTPLSFREFIFSPIGASIAVIGIVFIVFFVIYICNRNEQEGYGNIIGLAGILVSYLGIGFAIFQIQQSNHQIQNLESTTKAIQTAVADNSNKILFFNSSRETARLGEVIKNAQNYLIGHDYPCAVLLIQDIKSHLINIKNLCEEKDTDTRQNLRKTIKEITLDINMLFAAKEETRKRKSVNIDITVICSHLEDANSLIQEMGSHQQKQAYDTPQLS